MKALRAFLLRATDIFRRSRRERDLAEELEAHLDLHIADNVRRGMTPPQARREALLRLGGMPQTQEAYRAQRGLPFLEQLVQDLRFAFRLLRKDAGFATVLVLTLAFGIGSATAVFTVANAVLLRRAPYPDADRIVLLWGADALGSHHGQVSFTDIEDVRRRNHAFSAIANFGNWTPTLTGDGEAERLAATQVSDGFFDVIGVKPFLGRPFTSDEHIDGRDRVVILSYSLWKSRFAGDEGIIGRTILLSTVPHVIVGVMPREFEQLPSTLVDGGQLYRPVGENYDNTQRRSEHLRAIARLKPGVTLSQAQADVDRITRELASENKEDAGLSYTIVGFHDDTASHLRPSLLLLVGGAGLLLLIACSNAAGLLLARGSARQKEFALRNALGASRLRIARQALTESLLLAFTGGLLGMTLAYAASRACILLAPKLGSPLAHVVIDAKVLLFAVAAVFVTALLFGIVPALHATAINLSDALKQGGHGPDRAGRSRRFHSGIVIGQLALALIMISTAALLIRSFVRLQQVDIGFQTEDRLAANVWLPFAKYPKGDQQLAFYDELLRRISSLPGVRSAALVQNLPMNSFDGRAILGEGYVFEHKNIVSPEGYFVTPSYLRTMGIPLLRGRWFTDSDDQRGQPVAVISAGLAQRLWPGQDAVGRRLQLLSDKKVDDQYPFRTIVGVVGDVRHLGPDQRNLQGLYIPFQQFPVSYMCLVVHAEHPLALVPAIRREISSLDRDVPLFKVSTYSNLLANELLIHRLAMTLISVFAGVAVFLAGVGIYGLLAYVVSRRMPEFGVRAALGARPGDLLRLVLGSGLRLVVAGVAIGVACSVFSVRLVAALTVGTESPAPSTLVLSVAVLVAVAFLASFLPARSAAQADPMTTLRGE